MLVSKHHYAAELAKRGNCVYFLNPPNYLHRNFSEMVEIKASGFHPSLFVITDNIAFPFNVKFHFTWLFHLLNSAHIKAILKKINNPIDIVWSFDLANVYPLKYFPTDALKIFHPVDTPLNTTGIDAAKGAQFIFSTANDILEKYSGYPVPKQFINHGIAEEFLAEEKSQKTPGGIARVGFSGNLLREDIDRDILLEIIHNHPEIIFECWGSHEFPNGKLHGPNDKATSKFINELKKAQNILFHGPVPTNVLANGLHRMDAFLICYNLSAENRNGPNYHKLMEYISTGKVIISNFISVYEHEPGLVQMVKDRDHNHALPALFKKVMADLQHHNSGQLQDQRIEFAKNNTYGHQVARIEKILNGEQIRSNH